METLREKFDRMTGDSIESYQIEYRGQTCKVVSEKSFLRVVNALRIVLRDIDSIKE